MWWMCPNFCFGMGVVWNSPRLQCDARLFGLLIAPLVPVLWLGFNFIDGFIQAWLIGFVFTFNEAFKNHDPFETKVMDEWERVMGEAKHYNKQGFKDSFGVYLLPLPEGEKAYGCITLCCDSCVCGCILNLLSLILFWICGLLIMVIDIFACLLIYIFKLPEMLIFGWCRGCGELSGLFKWYNEQRNKHGAASCCACFADCYMSCACVGYGAYYALYPLFLVLYIIIVPFWAMSVSCRSTWVVWVTEDIPESLSNCYDARWLLWASFYNMCCQMAKKDVDENSRIPVVIDDQQNNHGNVGNNQQNQGYQPPNPPQPQNQGKKNRKNEATNFLSAATNGGMFFVGAAFDQIKQNREKKQQKKNGGRQKPTRQQQARNGFGFYHKQPAQNPAYNQQQPAQNPPYNQQQPAQNQSYNQQQPAQNQAYQQQQPVYNPQQQQQPVYNQHQQQQPVYNQQHQQQPPPNKNIYNQQQPAQQQPKQPEKKEYGEDKSNASRVQAAGNMFGNLVGNAVIGIGNAIKGDEQPNKTSNL